eukprot:768785-Hanusia_phi.AAC.8
MLEAAEEEDLAILTGLQLTAVQASAAWQERTRKEMQKIEERVRLEQRRRGEGDGMPGSKRTWRLKSTSRRRGRKRRRSERSGSFIFFSSSSPFSSSTSLSPFLPPSPCPLPII